MISERIFIIILIFIATFSWIKIIGTLFTFKSSKEELTSKIVVPVIYIANTFTISTIFWDYLQWTLFWSLLPLLLLFMIKIRKNDFFRINSLYYISVFIIFSYAFYGAYYVVSLFVISAFMLFAFLDFINKKINLKLLCHQFQAYIMIAILLSLPTLMLIIDNNQIHAGNILTLGISGKDILSIFKLESTTTTFSHVLTLSAFIWLYDYPTSHSYEWIHMLTFLQYIGLIYVFLFIVFIIRGRRNLIYKEILFLSTVAIVFSVGYNIPFKFLNYNLLLIGGPFDIITNAYYFLIFFYIIAICASIPYIIQFIFEPKKLKGILKNKNTKYLHKIFKAAAILILAIIILTPAYVLYSGQVNNTTGWNEHEFEIPQSFNQLHAFFQKNYTSPDYYVLIIPMSTLASIQLNLGNGSFDDSSNLFNAYIPYPTISETFHNQVEPFVTLDNLINSNKNFSWLELTEIYHIKYIVVNIYANLTFPFMAESPDGSIFNISFAENELNSSGLALYHVGSFLIYENPLVSPFVDIQNKIPLIDTNNYTTLVNNILPIKGLPNQLESILVNSIPVGAFYSNSSIEFQNINRYTEFKYPNKTSYTMYLINSNSTLYQLNNSESKTMFPAYPTNLLSIQNISLNGSNYIKSKQLRYFSGDLFTSNVDINKYFNNYASIDSIILYANGNNSVQLNAFISKYNNETELSIYARINTKFFSDVNTIINSSFTGRFTISSYLNNSTDTVIFNHFNKDYKLFLPLQNFNEITENYYGYNQSMLSSLHINNIEPSNFSIYVKTYEVQTQISFIEVIKPIGYTAYLLVPNSYLNSRISILGPVSYNNINGEYRFDNEYNGSYLIFYSFLNDTPYITTSHNLKAEKFGTNSFTVYVLNSTGTILFAPLNSNPNIVFVLSASTFVFLSFTIFIFDLYRSNRFKRSV